MSNPECSTYPPDWPAISKRIRNRDNWACQCAGHCGRHLLCGSTEYLGVAHLNHWPHDCRNENLLTLCWPCHSRYDALTAGNHPVRQAKRRAAAARRRAEREIEQQTGISDEPASEDAIPADKREVAKREAQERKAAVMAAYIEQVLQRQRERQRVREVRDREKLARKLHRNRAPTPLQRGIQVVNERGW